jgi:hypothetical protein
LAAEGLSKGTTRFVTTDLDGGLIRVFSVEGLGRGSFRDVDVITTGPNGGAFSAVDFRTSTMVVSCLD